MKAKGWTIGAVIVGVVMLIGPGLAHQNRSSTPMGMNGDEKRKLR